jgi:hypothetical protein
MHVGIFKSGECDWEGLYIDGTLKIEGHSISARDILEYLGKYLNFEIEVVIDEKESYLDRFGNSCPDTWEEAMS